MTGIKKNRKSLAEIILLNSFKKIADTMRLTREFVNLRILCEEIFDGFKGLAEKSNLDFKFNFDTIKEEVLCDNIKIVLIE